MDVTFKIWRSAGGKDDGRFHTYPMTGVDPSMSLLEVLDDLNDTLLDAPEGPVIFDHDCREGICGSCAMTINGVPHGGKGRLTACQLHMHRFKDGETITLEPFRAGPFPPLRDLASDRAALDRIQLAGGFITVSPGQAPDGNTIPIPKDAAERAFDLAACIGCGACVAACPNASAMLFLGAKVGHLNGLPQGAPERDRRTLGMVAAMEDEGFGSCSDHGECAAVCPKEIDLGAIAALNRAWLQAATREILSR